MKISTAKEIQNFNKTTYSDSELSDFGRTLEKYYKENQYGKYLDETAFLIDHGALSKDGSVILDITDEDEWGGIKSYKHPCRYEELNNKLSQWEKWKARRDFAEKKVLENLEEYSNF